MDDYIQISKLNDFIFCPYSIYLHSIYENFDTSTYHSKFQKRGSINHARIDNKTYSTSKYIIQGKDIYSQKYGLVGKIDLYDSKQKSLIERKYKITKIYSGYKLQLFAQYLCMQEMGYQVNKLCFHSLVDNKNYPIAFPSGEDLNFLKDTVKQIRNFRSKDAVLLSISPLKCEKCIYNNLCAFK